MKKSVILLTMLIVLGGCGSDIKAENCTELDQNESIVLGDVSLTMERMDIRKEVKPENPSGYYHYYEKKAGCQYYVITGTAENHGIYDLHGDSVVVRGTRDQKMYEAVVVFSDPEQKDFIKTLKANRSQRFYFIILMKSDQSKPNKLEIYYNDTFKKAKKKDSFDHLLKWSLPKLK